MKIFVGKGRTFSSWLIRVVTKSPYTHCGLVFDDGVVLHSTIGGCQHTDMEYIKESYDLLTVYECKFPEAEPTARTVERDWLGAKYDYLSFIGLGLALLFGLKKNPLGQHEQLLCTEVPAHWLNKISAANPSYRLPYLDPELVTPKEIYELLEISDDLFEKVI